MQITYLIIAIIVLLAVIAGLIILKNKTKTKEKPSFITGLSFAFMIASIAFGNSRIIGYSLLGAGVILAVVDIILKQRKK